MLQARRDESSRVGDTGVALSPSLRLLDAMLDQMHEGVCVYDEGGTIVFANRAAELMYGSAPGALVGAKLPDLSARPAWEVAHLVDALETRLREAGSWSGDRLNRRLNGKHFVTSAHVTPLEVDGRALRLCIEEDVTEQRRADERSAFLANATSILGQSLDYRETLREVARLCIPVLADFVTIDVFAEHGTPERVGCAHRNEEMHEQLCRSPWRIASVSRAPLLLRDVREETLASDRNAPDESERWHALGIRSWLSVPIRLHETPLGTIVLAMTEASGRQFGEGDLELLLDLATRAASAIENARLHAAATTARDEAERANRAKSELLAHASHDLRTPLNAIGGYAELLEMEILGPVSDAQRDALARIQRSQRHLLALINDLLNFTKLEAGHVEFDLMEIDLAHVAREVVGLFEDPAAAKQVEVRCDVTGAPRAWADHEKVFQILVNLLRNAVKFTPSGGRVTVSVREEGEVAEVLVADTGIGIPPDKVEAIFEPFTQLGRAFNRPQDGSGLGLAISRELTRAMRGELGVTSTVGTGATFRLTLPRSSRSPRVSA